jgi:hypothetical protein
MKAFRKIIVFQSALFLTPLVMMANRRYLVVDAFFDEVRV